jgi:prepilin-type N-terminal cleavage/methylation domain-containing protein
MNAPRSSQSGFTLIELMISLVLFSFAVAGIMSIAVVTSRSFKEQRRAIATENAARAPLDFLVDALRGASPGAPSATIGDGDNCVDQKAIVITDNTAAPDELDVVYASGGVVTTTYAVFTKADTEIVVPTAALASFAIGDYVLITDTNMGTILRVDGVTSTGLTVSPDSTCANVDVWPAGGYPQRSLVIRAQHAHFSIADLDGIPTLWMDPDGLNGGDPAEPLAEGVEDMQVAIGTDNDDDGALLDTTSTTDEWAGNASGDALGAGAIRAVKIILVARDATPLPGVASFTRPAALNRGAGSADNYRRRVLFSTIEIRNLTGSP